MTQWLKVLTLLPEDSSLIPSTNAGTTSCTSNSGGSDTFFWPPQASVHPRTTHTPHTQFFKKSLSGWAVMAHAFSCSNTWEAETDGSLSSRLTWSTYLVPDSQDYTEKPCLGNQTKEPTNQPANHTKSLSKYSALSFRDSLSLTQHRI